jgi:hypothetical protein
MKPSLSFETHYVVDREAELPPSGGPITYFKRNGVVDAGAGEGMSGPLLRISPKRGDSWLACFAGGYPGSGVADGVFPTPNPDVVCVISNGAGYWVNTKTREKSDVPLFPVRAVEAARDLLILADFTRLVAYGMSGLIWRSERLVTDRLSIMKIDSASNIAECRGWDPIRAAGEITFMVNLGDGRRIT